MRPKLAQYQTAEKEVNGKKRREFWFPDTESILQFAENQKDALHHSAWRGSNVFCGCSMKDAIDGFRHGMPDLISKLDFNPAASNSTRDVIPQFQTIHDVSGSGVDVGRYVSGIPENMLGYIPDMRTGRTINILVNIVHVWGQGADKILAEGKVLVGAIDWIEQQGFKVKVDASETVASNYSATTKDCEWIMSFCAKNYSEPLDIHRLGYMLAHPSMLRRLIFAVQGYDEKFNEECGWAGYGTCIKFPEDYKEGYDIVFDWMEGRGEEYVYQRVTQILKDKGAEIGN